MFNLQFTLLFSQFSSFNLFHYYYFQSLLIHRNKRVPESALFELIIAELHVENRQTPFVDLNSLDCLKLSNMRQPFHADKLRSSIEICWHRSWASCYFCDLQNWLSFTCSFFLFELCFEFFINNFYFQPAKPEYAAQITRPTFVREHESTTILKIDVHIYIYF